MSCYIKLKEKGLKLTPQRRLIVDIIHDARAHQTADEITALVQSRMPGVHKSTIYRTLELLEEAGSVFKSEMDDQFIFHHAEEGHHHHLVCRRCGKTRDIEENLFAAVEKSLGTKYGFRADLKHIVINGLCKNCLNKTN